jgi:hypothetical protein
VRAQDEGSDPFGDETVTAMLAHLPGERDIAARRIPAAQVTRDGIDALDLGDSR